MRGQVVRVTGRANRAIALLARLLPDALTTAVAQRQGRRFRRVGEEKGPS